MKIVVLKGSPHVHGASAAIADSFVEGATQAGHSVTEFNIARMSIHPCYACKACVSGLQCVQKDDMQIINDAILSADMIMFVTPVYYFAMSAQLKAVIDRFYSINRQLRERGTKSGLIVTSWDTDEETVKCVENHYITLCNYMHFKNAGTVLASGCSTAEAAKQSKYIQEAFMFGKTIK